MYRHHQGLSGPHSFEDAQQYAWARLIFGPGAPPPRMRPHRGQLPDVPEFPTSPRRPSLIAMLVRILTLRTILDPTVSGEVVEGAETKARARRARPGTWSREREDSDRKDRLAA